MSSYTCQRAIHPGEMLKEELEYRHIKQCDLARELGLSYNVLNDMLNCRRALTATTAMLLEAALGISATLMMRMQLDYNMQVARQDETFAQKVAKIRKIVAAF